MVNVTHDGDHRRARLELFQFVLDVEFNFFDRRVNHPAAALAFFHFKTETVFRAELLGDYFVNRLVHIGENAQFHQIGDDLERLLLELRGEFAHDNRWFDDDDFAGRGRDKFGLRSNGGLRRFARGRRRLTTGGWTVSLSGFRFLRRALTRRRKFDRTCFVASARRACR